MANLSRSIPLILLVVGITMADDHVVVTTSGPVRGTTTKSFSGKDIDAFYGIPYAEPPIGSLRFGPPVEVKPWTEELNATGFVLPCYQQVPSKYLHHDTSPEMRSFINMRPWTEDCLKLHVWVPKPRPANSTVMVYIHGGAFIMGDPQHPFFAGATMAAEENVIVVSMHYRLSILGFLNLEIPEAPGNVGLLDQQMALKWVQRNIRHFGGNPDDVTIYGLSAGGASVGYQLLAPKSAGLFKRAIIMSGTPNAPWVPNEIVLKESLKVATYLGCAKGDRTGMLQCLQSLHPEHFSQYESVPFIMERFCPTGPSIDGNFILDFPKNLLRNKEINQADLMIGTTAFEMSGFLAILYEDIFLKYPDGRITKREFMTIIDREFMNHDALTRKMLAFMYTNWTDPDDPYHLRDELIDLTSDYFFNCPSQEFADAYSSAGHKVYRYVIDYNSNIFPFPEWIRSSHGIDAILHTGMGTSGGNFTQEDAILSKKVMLWWANFARTGNPNGNDPSTEIWPESTLGGQEYLIIDHHPSLGRNFRKEQCGLLSNVMEIMAEHRRQRKQH